MVSNWYLHASEPFLIAKICLNAHQDDDGVLLDVLDKVLQENGGLASLAFNLENVEEKTCLKFV